jgi:carbon starvation protein
MIALVFLLSCAILLVAYHFYGRFLMRQFQIDDACATPAETMKDGVDFVPTKPAVLFGHHFSSIAGAGPIVGPIAAALAFGWGPTLLWILIGAILIGGVHDFGSLVMSIRHRARSIAEICKLYLSPLTYRFFLIFIWLALVYVLVVFLDLTAATFVDKSEINPSDGGTVATASIIYIALALIFGWAVRNTRLGLGNGSLVFVPLVFGGLAVAWYLPLDPDHIPVLFGGLPKYTWTLLLLIYCFIASITPVSVLLQPRDYLSSYLLFACLLFGGIGLLLGGAAGALPAEYPFFIGLHDAKLGYIFPALFITVACGAVSGFHCIVASGTTAKQLPAESAVRPIAYGAMLTEAALAVVALACVMAMSGKPASGSTATVVFASGIGKFLGAIGLPEKVGATFGLLAISTFLLTTLDTCTRLTRYIVEEFADIKGKQWRYPTTLVAIAPLFYFAFKEYPHPTIAGATQPAWLVIWPAFGTTNQLLAALALLVVTVWRRSQGRATWFTLWPMFFMLVTTVTSMSQLIAQHFGPNGVPIIGWINIAMLCMTALLVIDTLAHWGRLGRQGALAGGEVSAG